MTETTTITESGKDMTGDRRSAVAAHQFSVAYDAVSDILTIDGFIISGEFLRTLTATPCGTMFRIIERKDGVVTISSERDPLAAAAPDMLTMLRKTTDEAAEHLKNIVDAKAAHYGRIADEKYSAAYDLETARMERLVEQSRAVIAKAEGRRSPAINSPSNGS